MGAGYLQGTRWLQRTKSDPEYKYLLVFSRVQKALTMDKGNKAGHLHCGPSGDWGVLAFSASAKSLSLDVGLNLNDGWYIQPLSSHGWDLLSHKCYIRVSVDCCRTYPGPEDAS